MAKRKRFTPEFKAEVVLEGLNGGGSEVSELCRRHSLSNGQLSKWKRQLLENAATLFETGKKPSNEAIERIAQLEQLVSRLTLTLDIEKKPRLKNEKLLRRSGQIIRYNY